jgi:hypothetical protein
MSYTRFIADDGMSWEEAIAARDQLWREDLLTGEETQDEAAYRLRSRSVENGDFKAVICDRCGERPAHAGVGLFGSPEWILECADNVGWAVPKRWGLEMPLPAPEDPDLTLSASRTFAICESCLPAPADYYGTIHVVVEPGYEESWESFVRWRSEGVR